MQSVPLSALELGLETEAAAAVKQEPETVSTPALLNVRVRAAAPGLDGQGAWLGLSTRCPLSCCVTPPQLHKG